MNLKSKISVGVNVAFLLIDSMIAGANFSDHHWVLGSIVLFASLIQLLPIFYYHRLALISKESELHRQRFMDIIQQSQMSNTTRSNRV